MLGPNIVFIQTDSDDTGLDRLCKKFLRDNEWMICDCLFRM